MIDQSSLISIASAIAVIAFNYGTSRSTVQNTKDSLSEFKVDIKEEIQKEKRHALELANQRIGAVEKDVDEIWPRLREAEDTGKKNCFNLTNMQKNCKLHKDINP